MGEQGELIVVPTAEDLLGDDERSFLRAVANVLAGAMTRLRGEERMRHEALHDPLTGLANRTLCRDRIVHALARSGRANGAACVLFIDLDAFKRVNDIYGHAAGDALLVGAEPPAARHRAAGGHGRPAGRRRVRDRLRGHRRGHGDRARPPADGGDRRAAGRARRRARAVGEHRDRARHRRPAATRTRCWPTPTPPPTGRRPRGAARVEVFDRRLRRHAQERLRTAEALERALSLGQLRLAFQPIVALDGGAVVGHEALLRWDRPGGGASAPADFIPVAEESALIVEIGALGAAAGLPRAGRRAAGAVWVNLSPRQLAQPDLPDDGARRCLAETGLAPRAAAAGADRGGAAAGVRGGAAQPARARAARASASPSTTSARATRRSGTCATCRWPA